MIAGINVGRPGTQIAHRIYLYQVKKKSQWVVSMPDQEDL